MFQCSTAQPSGDAREVLDDTEDDNLTEVANDLAVQAAEGATAGDAAQYHNVMSFLMHCHFS